LNARRARARVLLIGVGGLGSPCAIALARAGIGTLGFVDDDVVERTNLHRQILFSDADVGRSKIEAAREALHALAPDLHLEGQETRISPKNADALMARYDLVVEGSDNFATKFLTADVCARLGRPVVHAASVRWIGTVLAVGAKAKPCYRCLFEDVPREDAPNCAEAGVMGPVVGIVAALQADLALAMIDGSDVAGTLVTVNGEGDVFRRRRLRPRPSCNICSNTAEFAAASTRVV
jgi:molybdopterin/thiamine biosynthesis adenylyltransferase